MIPSNAIIFYNAFLVEIEASNNEFIVLFSIEMSNSVINKTVVAATNALVKDSNISGC